MPSQSLGRLYANRFLAINVKSDILIQCEKQDLVGLSILNK
jgi:hypothetical protein